MAPTKELTNGQAKWLTYLVWILIMLMSASILGQFDIIREQNERITNVEKTVIEIKDNYTPLERHRSDTKMLCNALSRIDSKLDRLIERQIDN